jgi:hypothetical protein
MVATMQDKLPFMSEFETTIKISYHERLNGKLEVIKSMLDKLPLEIQIRIISSDLSSSLKQVNKHFYCLYNNLFYDKLINTFGEDILDVIVKVIPWLKLYIKCLDSFRIDSRRILAKINNLEDIDQIDNPFNCCYIKDLWKYIYSVLKNKRLFAEYNDYQVDEPTNYIFNHYVEVNHTYLLSYKKRFWLAPGKYNLNIALIAQNISGLGTTKFEIKYNYNGEKLIQTFFPPTNINDILPKDQFCFLKIGEFSINPGDKNLSNKLIHVECSMEEIGLYRKSGFSIFFIDISETTLLFNDYELLYYTVKETDYRYFINVPLKNFYKALDYVQKTPTKQSTVNQFGLSDPNQIADEYDFKFMIDNEISGKKPLSKSNSLRCLNSINSTNISQFLIDLRHSESIMRYSNFFFNNKYKNRYFKFNTIYQRRQFINRYGDFDADWKHFNEANANGQESTSKHCSYDKLGLKWKIPVVCDL